MRFRGKSIRRKIVALLLVPLVSLTAIGGVATVVTWREADQLRGVEYIVDKVGYPIEDAARVLQEERRQALVYLADPRASDALATLRRQHAATDAVLSRIKSNAEDEEVQGELAKNSKSRLASIVEAFDGIESLRHSVEDGPFTRAQALDIYTKLIAPCYDFLQTLHGLDDVEMDKQGRALVGVTRARELLSREDALLGSALVAQRIEAPELRQISDLIAQRELLYEVNLSLLPHSERERFEQFWKGPATAPLRAAEKTITAARPGAPQGLTSARWDKAAGSVLDELKERNTAAGDRYQDRVAPIAVEFLLKAGAVAVLGLLSLAASLFLSIRVGRGLVRDLSRLSQEAHEASGVRLPSVMRRLAAGEHVDVSTEAPRLVYAKDELGQVGQALNTLQRAAVEAAVKQADMRRGVSEVFVNLARRSQVLLHKQLTLLDTMERRTEDTEELADLFRLDHLTTRMRRHAEGLVILSGAAPSRQWRRPVQLMDVVRAAVAEVEDYERIEVRRLPRIAVTGPAVADLTHLAAELLENATVFSPPHTAVQVHGDRVANGFTLEIHDRGLGMTQEALLDANLRLAETPEFELSDTDRLGLFVVSRLAQRQHIRVSLQPSPYGGTTAVIFIPDALLTEAQDTDGAGFRLDRARQAQRHGTSADRTVQLSKVPVSRPGLPHSVVDGPVELEAPVGSGGLGIDVLDDLGDLGDLDDFGGLGDIGDEDSERGGLFRPRRPAPASLGERHRRPGDEEPAGGAKDRHGEPSHATSGPVPLPRRRTPKLVSSHGRRVTQPRDRGPERPTGPVRSVAPEPAPERTDPTEPTGDATPTPQPGGALPRRVRQASIAPQLRDSQPREPAADDPPLDDRDPDEVRSRMASLQRGWQRGRRDNAASEAPEAPQAQTQAQTAATPEAPDRTTPEGDGR
ncbi:sensor histidine kinase [Streptomyces apocyni]|uniref:sensor histidine kinase n=1 Tax=Streptomyces apocyni TaxID=2654677 RepID=UPI0012EACF90|nr:nitrate- and nitrite sensing domain-containing protein [Streptomyces apocyni]